MDKLYGKVEDINLVKNISTGLDLCSITIDFDQVYIYYDVNELISFVGNDVSYTLRPDVIDGVPTQVICNIAKLVNVNVVDPNKITRLIPETEERTTCNFITKDLKLGEYYKSCIGLLMSIEVGSSSKSRWIDCKFLDKASKTITVRLFTIQNRTLDETEEWLKGLIGYYMMFDLEYTKYGFQTKEFTVLENGLEHSPAVSIAEERILQLAATDELVKEYIERYDLINAFKGLVDYEPGYLLVRIATLLSFIDTLDNVSNEFDIKSMRRAAVMTFGYMLPHKTEFSRGVLNINKILYSKDLVADKELVLMLDVLSTEEFSNTKKMFILLKQLTDRTLTIRKDDTDEEVNNVLFGAFTDVNRLY